MKKVLAVLLTAAALGASPANAIVQYDFTAFSSFDMNGEQITGGGFSFIAPNFLTSDTTISVDDLLNCSVATTATPVGACRDQDILFHVLPDFETISFGISTPLNPAIGVYYYFAAGAFGAEGSYESQIFGDDQAGRLVVTDLDGNSGAIPEPANWALMIAGFGLVGAFMRQRQRVAADFA